MRDPFRVAATRARLEKKGDVTLVEDRGWTIVSGKGSSPEPVTGFENLVNDGFLANPVVAACAREILTSLSEAPIRAYKLDADGNPERMTDHPAEELMDRPNPRDSRVEFIERTGAHFLFGGNTIWVKHRGGGGDVSTGRIEMLRPLPPSRYHSAVTDENDFPTAFKLQLSADKQTPTSVPVEQLVHIPDIHPMNDVWGAPRIRSAGGDIATDNSASRYVAEVLENHGSPGLLLGVSTAAEESQIRRAETKFEERFGPGRGRGKIGFVPGLEHAREIGFSLKDLEFLSLRGVTRESICSAMGIDPKLLGLITATGGASLGGTEYREARRKFWVQTMFPIIRRWEAAMNAFVAPEFGANVYLLFDLTEVPALMEDRNAAIDRAHKMAQTGVFTVGEIRTEAGYDADVEEEELVGAQGPEKEDDEDDDGDESAEDEEADEGGKAAGDGIYPDPAFPELLVRWDDMTDEDKEKKWQHWDAFARSREYPYGEFSKEHFEKEKRETDALVGAVLEEEMDKEGGEPHEGQPFPREVPYP